ncbi:DEAD/DEAH box helicase family protein [Streptomyces sp. NPDC004838]
MGQGDDQIPALTVICTYDALNKIEETEKTGYAVPPFDLAIMDEAHRIASRTDKKWAAVNDAKRIHAERRLYMTAPPLRPPDLDARRSTVPAGHTAPTTQGFTTSASSSENRSPPPTAKWAAHCRTAPAAQSAIWSWGWEVLWDCKSFGVTPDQGRCIDDQ